MIKNYKAWGIDARREQYGTWRGWRRGPSHVDLMKPFVRSLEATMEGDSPGTGGKDVIGTTIILPMVADSNEFVKWLPAREGEVRADLGGVSDVSPRGGMGGAGDAGVEGAHGHDDRQARRRLGRREFETPAIPVTRRQSDGQSRHAAREGRRGGRHRLQPRQPDGRRVGHVDRVRHEEQDGARRSR